MTLTTQELQRLRVRLGLDKDDTSHDADIQTAWDTSLALAERYCNRLLEYKPAWVEKFIGEGDYSLSLERYPLEAVASVTDDDGQALDPDCYDFDKYSGVLLIRGHGKRWLTVTYAGGYNPIPGDLWLALVLTFDNVYAAAFTATSDEAFARRTIKALAVPDVGRIEYATGDTDAASAGVDPSGMIPGSAVANLNWYRREYC